MKKLSLQVLFGSLVVALLLLVQAAAPMLLPFNLTGSDSNVRQPFAQASAAPTLYLPWTANDEWYVSQDWGTDCCPACSHCGPLLYAWDFQKLPADTQAEGQPVLAVAPGNVITVVNSYAGPVPGATGNLVILDHGGGYYSQYRHLTKQEGSPDFGNNGFVRVGQHVLRGQQIGRVGNTGQSSGPHLHFQLQTGPEPNSQSVPVSFVDVTRDDGRGYGIPVYGHKYISQNYRVIRQLKPFDVLFSSTTMVLRLCQVFAGFAGDVISKQRGCHAESA